MIDIKDWAAATLAQEGSVKYAYNRARFAADPRVRKLVAAFSGGPLRVEEATAKLYGARGDASGVLRQVHSLVRYGFVALVEQDDDQLRQPLYAAVESEDNARLLDLFQFADDSETVKNPREVPAKK